MRRRYQLSVSLGRRNPCNEYVIEASISQQDIAKRILLYGLFFGDLTTSEMMIDDPIIDRSDGTFGLAHKRG